MDLNEHLARAREARRKATEQRNGTLQFLFAWRSGGSEIVCSWEAAASKLGIRATSLRAYISTGRGRYAVERPHPATGEPDILTVTRLDQPSAANAKPKRRPGRPRKNFGTEDAS